jgi:NAD+ dependent glucose-6-phosphate dehydrogenase
MMKSVVLIGGSGTVGTALTKAWKERYRMTVLDMREPEEEVAFVRTDATCYEELLSNVPRETDVLLNLLQVPSSNDVSKLDKMTDVFFKASVYILEAAVKLAIPKVVFASSNHVTDFYELGGHSMLGREIKVSDYPLSRGIYGILKLASENAGHMYAHAHPLSVINIRIGTVPKLEQQALQKDERIHHTLLTREDLATLFAAAIETTSRYGTFYGVSDNPDKPWSMEEAYRVLDYASEVNSTDLL